MLDTYDELLNKAHEMPGYQYNWVCSVCLRNAISGILLQFQLLDEYNPIIVLFDSDSARTPWIICNSCEHKFHLHCVTCMSVEEVSVVGKFYCCDTSLYAD